MFNNFVATMNFKSTAVMKNRSQQGFSLFETVIAAMISLTFISLGGNLVLTANLYKVVAKKNQAMTVLIQSDLDGIKDRASKIAKGDSNIKCNPANVNDGYANDLKSKLGTNNAPINVQILKNNYTMTRTSDPIANNADILTISYLFTRQGFTTPEYDLNIQIIPNAAFTCPRPI